jgi:hypothetical protein
MMTANTSSWPLDFKPMSDQELWKLEGLVIGLDQQGEKSAAQQVRWACSEIAALRPRVAKLEAALEAAAEKLGMAGWHYDAGSARAALKDKPQ